MRLRKILNESIGVQDLLAPLAKGHRSALNKLIKFDGKPTNPHDVLEDRLSELADNKRLAALFLPHNGSTEPSEIDAAKLPSWCGLRRYGGPDGSVVLFKKENEDIVDAMYADMPIVTRHAVRGIVFGYEPDKVVEYSLNSNLSNSWRNLLEEDGWILSDGSKSTPEGKRGYSSVYFTLRHPHTGNINVWLSDMNAKEFITRSLEYGEPHDAYQDGSLIYPGICMECRNCHIIYDLLRNNTFRHGDDDEDSETTKLSPCLCDRRMNELNADLILSAQTMARLNRLNIESLTNLSNE